MTPSGPNEPFVARAPDVLTRRMSADELLVIRRGRGTVVSLAGTSAALWDELADRCRVDELVDRVARRFGLDADDVAAPARHTIDTLVSSGLVELWS